MSSPCLPALLPKVHDRLMVMFVVRRTDFRGWLETNTHTIIYRHSCRFPRNKGAFGRCGVVTCQACFGSFPQWGLIWCLEPRLGSSGWPHASHGFIYNYFSFDWLVVCVRALGTVGRSLNQPQHAVGCCLAVSRRINRRNHPQSTIKPPSINRSVFVDPLDEFGYGSSFTANLLANTASGL